MDNASAAATSVESILTKKTKAIIPVHLYGHPCNMDSLKKICDKNDLIIVEDCAQALGAEYRGRKVGSFGKAAAFSFYPTKNIGAYGVELKDVFLSCEVFNFDDFSLKDFNLSDCEFEYRNSVFKKNKNLIIVLFNVKI